eukprot:4279684-Pyramimonas_sp.AAC.1
MAATAQPGTTSCCSRMGVPCGRTIPTPPARPPVGPRKPGESTISSRLETWSSIPRSRAWTS